jgi:signal transduction histidine kinase
MKRYYYVSILAIAVIACLQGLYISLQYKEFVNNRIININNILTKSIDEELGLRSRKNYKPDKIGNQHMYYHVLSDKEKDKLKKPGQDVINMKSLDLNKLRRNGIANTMAEVLSLIFQDVEAKKGNPVSLKILDKLFSENLKDKYQHSILLLDANKKTISIYGRKDIPYNWDYSKDYAISLQSPKFIRVAIDITPSDFIKESVWSLILSLLFVGIAMGCIGYQLRVIRKKEKLLKNRELSINGTIHDLKSPLNSIITLLSFLKATIKDANIIKLIEQTSDRTKSLVFNIETLLITARGTTKKIILKKEPVDLSVLAEKARLDVDILFNSKPHNIEVHNKLKADVHPLADTMYIENIIRNLIENALKYSDEGVNVVITIYNDAKNAYVSVADNGWGIPQKDISKIFNQFYRVPHDNAPRGYGIGLALVKYVVESHGGHIKVKSLEYEGTEFVFSIPLSYN